MRIDPDDPKNESTIARCVVIDYTNWRGERAERIIRPLENCPPTFKATEHHPDEQYLLDAADVAKGATRTFALKDIHSWRPASKEDFARLLYGVSGRVVDVKPEDLRTAAGKVYEMFKGCFWVDGGWLSCVGEAKDKILVMTSRELYPFERDKIPAEMDGVPIEVKVVGIPQML